MGLVQDSESNPVANVCVFTWRSGKRVYAETDEEGAFKLLHVPRPGGYLYARADGFRFYGSALEADAENIRIRLTRATEAPARIIRCALRLM